AAWCSVFVSSSANIRSKKCKKVSIECKRRNPKISTKSYEFSMHFGTNGLLLMLLIVALATTVKAQYHQCSDGDTCVNIRGCALFNPHNVNPALWSNDQRSEFRKRIYSVCCGKNDIRKHGLELLHLEGCETKVGGRIARLAFAEDAEIYEYPWMAHLITNRGDFLCGGTLIAERYVLTVAHCFRDRNVAKVRLGEFDRSNQTDCDKRGKLCADPPQDIDIERSIIHEDFSSRRKKNDIALARLAGTATLNDNVFPICLPVAYASHPNEELIIRRRYFTVGWGQTHEGTISNKLQYIKLNLLTNEECKQQLRQLVPDEVQIYDTQICAIGINLSNSCPGDNGGPLISFNINGRYVLYGMVSYGLRTCGIYRAPTVYTKVTTYIKWILNNMEE
uniref:Peptidase S1 domain-containing protein n=1 Tax=Anopheles dirus TaxID=7168 RepID=A0A182NF78_9DIPT